MVKIIINLIFDFIVLYYLYWLAKLVRYNTVFIVYSSKSVSSLVVIRKLIVSPENIANKSQTFTVYSSLSFS